MSGFLFDKIVFGPINSRRFGLSLGMNLLPTNYKNCTFNCIYCECGWTYQEASENIRLHSRKEIKDALEEKLKMLILKNILPDNITFAGNGEPTIHPEFPEIIFDTLLLRNKYLPRAEISVLSNASMIQNEKVFNSLLSVDNNVLKLDAGTESTFQIINQPVRNLSLDVIVDNLKKFKGNLVIQTLFVKGFYNGQIIDNTQNNEVDAWLGHIKMIKPKYVMIYPIARATPAEDLLKIPHNELELIADKVRKSGFEARVYS
ncbi:radical SAM protein [candidate division KSB1 bacterium]